jgi:N-acetylglutamate synthase-like GNAT family acetyltransferase
MEQQEITIRRAKPSDAEEIAAFVNNAWYRPQKIDQETVLRRFGTVGFLLAERNDELIGMLGWQVENLVVGLTDFLINPAAERITIGQTLLTEMEGFAQELQCEAALMFLPRPTPHALIEFCETLEYESQIVASLLPAWQATARERGLGDNDAVMVKKLSERRVLRPI